MKRTPPVPSPCGVLHGAWPARRENAGAGRMALLMLLLNVGGCALTRSVIEPATPTAREEAVYQQFFPYYAETCALTQLGKKSGFGAEIYSGVGGHDVLYLNGVCRTPAQAYPVLQMCDAAPRTRDADGVGITVNAHYRNAAWVAVEGRGFFFSGDLRADEALTREQYRAVQREAVRRGIYDGIEFHPEFLRDMPGGFTRDEFRYEISIATDYAIAFGRNRYCARVPMSRAQMLEVVSFLNRINEPYRTAQKVFDWNIFTHNCAHINHNALSAAKVWAEWPMDRPLWISIFNFPVPKNEFVNLVRRTNDFDISDPATIYQDLSARTQLMTFDQLPTTPGSIIDLGPLLAVNALYNTHSEIIFYDQPWLGPYQRRFEEILRQPRYARLQDNLQYFDALYTKILESRQPVESYLVHHPDIPPTEGPAFRTFYARYYRYVETQRRVTRLALAQLGDGASS